MSLELSLALTELDSLLTEILFLFILPMSTLDFLSRTFEPIMFGRRELLDMLLLM